MLGLPHLYLSLGGKEITGRLSFANDSDHPVEHLGYLTLSEVNFDYVGVDKSMKFVITFHLTKMNCDALDYPFPTPSPDLHALLLVNLLPSISLRTLLS